MARYLKSQTVAERLDVSIHTVRYWLRIGTLPSVRPGRRRLILEADLEAFLTRNGRGRSTAAAPLRGENRDGARQ
jgi:excisionase family DNA binding protein